MSNFFEEGIYDEVDFPRQERIKMEDNKCYSNSNTIRSEDLKFGSVRQSWIKKPTLILAIVVVVLAVLCSVAVTIAFVEIYKLKSELRPLTTELKSETASVSQLTDEINNLTLNLELNLTHIDMFANCIKEEFSCTLSGGNAYWYYCGTSRQSTNRLVSTCNICLEAVN